MVQSSGVFDLAINGQGFFRLTQRNGAVAYTRAGNFSADDTGRLVSADGLPLADDIVAPVGTTSLSVGPDGTVTATDSAGVVQPIGELTLTGFQNVNGLDRIGDNLFRHHGGERHRGDRAPGTNGLGTVTTGELEQSNVNLSAELTSLVIAQRSLSFGATPVRWRPRTRWWGRFSMWSGKRRAAESSRAARLSSWAITSASSPPNPSAAGRA